MDGVKMKVRRKIIEIDDALCDGCGQCVPACAEGALAVIDGKARVIADVLCDGLGACIGDCPTGALKIVEREAEEFDEAEVEKHLVGGSRRGPVESPSGRIEPPADCKAVNQPCTLGEGLSFLSHWPVQIRLIPPNAPFLKNADLLAVADCSAIALPKMHQEWVRGRVVMMGCPKFDDTAVYAERFAEIFRTNDVCSITVMIMDVPCCSGLPKIVQKGLALAGKGLPVRRVVVSRQGEIIADVMPGEEAVEDLERITFL